MHQCQVPAISNNGDTVVAGVRMLSLHDKYREVAFDL